MNTPLYIAKRYLFSKSSNNVINIITKIAMIGVIISTIALFVVLAAFTGLKTFNYQFLNTSDPDIKISPAQGKSFLFTKKLTQALSDNNIASFSKIIEEHALLANNDKRVAVTIKGVDDAFLQINAIDSAIYIGEWLSKDFSNGIVVGNSIASKITTFPNSFQDNLKVYVVKPGKGQLNINSFKNVRVQTVGIFRLTQDIDNQFIFAPISLVRELLNYNEDQITSIAVKLNGNINPDDLALVLQEKLGDDLKVQTRYQLNTTFYKMLNMENLFAYLITTLIGIIAFFNVIGAIIMMILDKREDIKTLFNLGLHIKELKRIYYFQGLLLTLYGMGIGLIIAIVIVVIQDKFELFMINPSLAYPVEFRFTNLILVIVTILGLGFIAAIIASSRISKKLIA